MRPSKNTLNELQTIITRMSLNAVCAVVVPEFGVKWKDVSHAVRNARMPMQASSVAHVLCRHAAKSLPQDELDEILKRLRLKLVATQPRTWHVVHLQERTAEEPAPGLLWTIPGRVLAALRDRKKSMRPEVQSVTMGDLLYLSVQFVSDSKEGPVVYMSTPPGEPVALFSSLASSGLVQACVEGLGYASYENAMLHGKDIPSLLRIASHAWAAPADQLTHAPEYNPTPTLTHDGIDYTNKNYNEIYVENLLGPDPPLLTDLTIKSNTSFFDRSRLDKTINLTVRLKSDDVSKSLKSWVEKSAILPTSNFFKIFHENKSNKIQFSRDSD